EHVCVQNEAEVALVDQIGERYALVLIFLGDGDDESQVRSNQRVESVLVVLADALRELHFHLASDEGKDADVPEVLIKRFFVDGRFPIRRNLHSDSVILSQIERQYEFGLRTSVLSLLSASTACA